MSAVSDGLSAVPEGVPEHDAAKPTGTAVGLFVWECEQCGAGQFEFCAERSGRRIDRVAVFVSMDGELCLKKNYNFF